MRHWFNETEMNRQDATTERFHLNSSVAYLASPEAAYVTGVGLTIDGGFTA
jgi:NAD(P)-dependent dehydrogenase (short-subunit alcohol dehydrogenase family)